MVSLAELEDELLDEPSAQATRAATKLGATQDTKQANKSDVDEEDTFMIRKSRPRCAAPAPAAVQGRTFGSTAHAPSSSGHGHAASANKARKIQGSGRKFNKGLQDTASSLGSAALTGASASKGASSFQQQTISSFCRPRGSSQPHSKKTPSTETCPLASMEPEETQLRVRLCDPPYGASSSEEHTTRQRSAHGIVAESGDLPCSSSGAEKAAGEEEPPLQGKSHAKRPQGELEGLEGQGEQGERQQQQQREDKGKAPVTSAREAKPEQRRVTFAPGPLRDIYGTEDGHPDSEGRTARPAPPSTSAPSGPPSASSSVAAAATAPFTAANLEALRVMLGPDCRPSLERLERRLAATASSSGLGARAARSRAIRDAKAAPAPAPAPPQSTASSSPSERSNLPSPSDTSTEQAESKEAQQRHQEEDSRGTSKESRKRKQGEGGKEEEGEEGDSGGGGGQLIVRAAQAAAAPER